MITDKAKELLVAHLKTLVNTAQIGYGGNSTSPKSTTLDVPSGITVSDLTTELTDENVAEVKMGIAGSNITGKVVREAAIFDSSSNMLARVNFSGVGPLTSTETLEIILQIKDLPDPIPPVTPTCKAIDAKFPLLQSY